MKSTNVATIRPMRVLLAVLGVAVAARAARAECTVDVARAPADVRSTIESWVAQESHCAHAIEVRVVPTEGGLYLYARDEHGVVRERVVPDAQAAGVLVASWVADDSPVAPVRVMPIIVPPKPAPAPVIEAPGVPTARPGHHSGVLFSLGGHASLAIGYAMRGELALEGGGWQAYLGASIGQTRVSSFQEGPGTIDLMPVDKRLALGVGRAFGTGTWQLRTRAGIQYAKWSGVFSMTTTPDQIYVEFAGIESSVQLSRKLTPTWSFTTGVDFSHFFDHQQSNNNSTLLVNGPAFELGLGAGLDVKL